MYNGNVRQNPLCIEPCVTKEFSIFPRFSPTIFDPDANLVLLRAHLYTAVDYMRRKPCVQNCSRDREGLYNGNVQQNPLCAASCVTKNRHISPRFSPTTFYRDAISVLLLLIAQFCTAVIIGSLRRTLCAKLFLIRALTYDFLSRCNSVLLLAHLCTTVLIGSLRRSLCSKLFMMRA